MTYNRLALLCFVKVAHVCRREDVAHLSLYNLSIIHKKKYFDSEVELMSYINNNWELLQLGEVSARVPG